MEQRQLQDRSLQGIFRQNFRKPENLKRDIKMKNPVCTFLDRLCTQGEPNNISRETKEWKMEVVSGTRDWVFIDIEHKKSKTMFRGSFDFWTKELVITGCRGRICGIVESKLREIYPEMTVTEV